MKVCSLFSGIGGIDLAFQQAGFEIVWANEFDRDAAKTYRHNFGGDHWLSVILRALEPRISRILTCLLRDSHANRSL